ncbi:MAG: M23 family metallopeptidase [Chloroflexi bacterium]|nr:M23 family metallopeptidase [Chloroflexota bacterium]
MPSHSPHQANTDASSTAEGALSEDVFADDSWNPGRRFWLRLRRELSGEGADRFTPVRLASHLALVGVVVGLLLLSKTQLPEWRIEKPDILSAPPPTATPVSLSQLVVARGGAAAPSSSAGSLMRMAVPFTTIPERPRLDVETYVVQPGDTVFGIAKKFNLQPETLMWSNRNLELNPDLLRVGDELTILPVDGVYHKVEKGDTISALAKKYKVKPAAIIGFEWNKLEDANQPLQPGTYLIIPGGKKPFIPRTVSIYRGPIPKNAKRGTGAFVWPVSGTITQQYWNGHRALDIGSWMGNPVVAADSGYVVFAGWDKSGYGNLIVIDHGNGYRTYYAHLSRIFVRRGESVGKGQRIGSVGSSGNSTGPHLHFEIRFRNVQRNPFGFLR